MMRLSRLLAALAVIEVGAISAGIEVPKIGSRRAGCLGQCFDCGGGLLFPPQISTQTYSKPFPPPLQIAGPRPPALHSHSPLKYSAWSTGWRTPHLCAQPQRLLNYKDHPSLTLNCI